MTMAIAMDEERKAGRDKGTRYGWWMVDRPGRFEWVHKSHLKIDPAYQRDHTQSQILALAREWSWSACGALSVSQRGDDLFVFDGATRLKAARKRSDIQDLPCMIFEKSGQKTEAQAFIDVNTNRSTVSAVSKYRAALVAEDPLVVKVQAIIDSLGLRVGAKPSVHTLAAIGTVMAMAKRNIDVCASSLSIAYELSSAENAAVSANMLCSVNLMLGRGLFDDPRVMERMRLIGHEALIAAATRKASIIGQGSPEIWASGMVDEINKGLRRKIQLKA